MRWLLTPPTVGAIHSALSVSLRRRNPVALAATVGVGRRWYSPADAACLLLECRSLGQAANAEPVAAVSALGIELDESSAYVLQGAQLHQRQDQVGWKVGATTAAAQAALGLASPFHGPLFEEWCAQPP